VIEDTTRNHGRQDSHHRCTPEADTAPAEAGAPSLIWPSLVVGATSRAALFVLVYFSSSLLAHRNVGGKLLTPDARDFTGLVGRLFNPWANWDGVWYIRIAGHGYAAYPDSQAFFPLYPLLVHYLGRALGSEFELAGIVLSLACFLALCVMLYKLAAREFSPRVGYWTVVFLSVFPTSLFFQAVYTESLFVLLVVTCFYFSRRGTWPLAGLAGLLATATHVSGIVLVLPTALLYLRERGWDPRRIRLSAAALLLVPGGLLLWMAYLKRTFGDALLFRQAEAHWGRTFAWPWQTVARGVSDAYYGLKGIPYQPLVAGRPQRRLDQVAKYYVDNPDSTMRSSSATSPRSSPSPWLGS
jgi:Mannosyltransferase (PIG-V)